MTVQICSLIVSEPQSIPADGQYHVVRFPFGSGESSDDLDMHQMAQPDGYTITDWHHDDRSGLIWPSVEGWGSLNALMYWDDGSYSEIRSRFVRDPLNLATGFDSTCTEDAPATPGGQYRAKHWEIFVHPGTPLALMVKHDAGRAVNLAFAEFKLAIHC
ncbi:hypothetical protein ACFYRN_24785 [Streptomyces sp. NPDC005227]|uniref:hypothetical protein n=1 Tax=Streptomyces sp. NPDC005227 TaxID=3364707 RepID=UPI0036854866